MSLYLMELVKTLDAENDQWRKTTVLVMDGASYHVAKETRATMSDLHLPVLFLGPYSYLISPIELFLAVGVLIVNIVV